MDKKNIQTRAKMAFKALVAAQDKAKTDLINIIQDSGGIIRIMPSRYKPAMYAYGYDDIDLKAETIQALAYDEGEGLMVMTSDELSNYEYDNGYEFGYYYDYEGEDLEHYEDATKDITYFRVLDDGYTDVNATVHTILAGLADCFGIVFAAI